MTTKTAKQKKGFTLVEVMLVLAITGLMILGVLGGTYSSIASQRYNDSLRNFAEYMRSIYAEAISPASVTSTEGMLIGNSSSQAILGKVIVFGLNGESTVYSATLVGSADINNADDYGFLTDITNVDVTGTSVFCGNAERPSSVRAYTPLWEAQLAQANDVPLGSKYNNPFVGTMIIARTPVSATIHTIFAKGITYDFEGDCTSANTKFRDDLKYHADYYEINEPTGICVVSDNSRIHREIRIAADGRNASAVWLRPGDEDNKCRL